MAETYRYFAWKEKGYWRGQSLLTRPQITALLTAHAWKKEVFTSIQSYDEFGNCLTSPLYFDFDGEAQRVLFDVRHFVQACEFVINCTPRIFFSGTKGFHLIIDYPINHAQCHLLVKDFAEEIALVKTLDTKVYRSQALFRLPGSPASTPGFYKIQITRHELFNLNFEQIRDIAKNRRIIPDDHQADKIDTAVMDAWLKVAIPKLPTYDTLTKLSTYSESVGLEMTPCIQTLLTQPQPTGQRHESVFILARFFKLCGLDIDTTRKAIETYEHWSIYEQQEGDITKVLKSVFHNRKPIMLGCKGQSVSASLMRDHCNDLCPFNAAFPKLNVIDTKGVTHLV